MSRLDTLAEEVFLTISCRVRMTGGPGRGQCHRSNLDPGSEVDAALSILLTRGRIEAYQRSETWTYTLPSLRPFSHPALDMLRDSNPDIVEEAARNPEVEAAAVDWVKRNQHRVERTFEEVGIAVGGRSFRSSGHARFSTPKLEVEYHIDGGVRLVER